MSENKGRANRNGGRPSPDNRIINKPAIFNFKLSRKQQQAGSDKSGAGRIFNLGLLLRLEHQEFIEQPLEVSRARLDELWAKHAEKLGLIRQAQPPPPHNISDEELEALFDYGNSAQDQPAN